MRRTMILSALLWRSGRLLHDPAVLWLGMAADYPSRPILIGRFRPAARPTFWAAPSARNWTTVSRSPIMVTRARSIRARPGRQ
jgi:hypothetical protein